MAAFEPHRPIRLWRHRGLDCAIYWGSSGFNGYVRIPEESPLRVEAAMQDIVARERASAAFREFGSPLSEAIVKIHGSLGYDLFHEFSPELTYGPDEEGWLGFDTAHYRDDWPDEVIDEYLLTTDPDAYDRFKAVVEIMRQAGMSKGEEVPWPAGRMLPPSQRRTWSMELLTDTVHDLVEYILARQIMSAPAREEPSAADEHRGC